MVPSIDTTNLDVHSQILMSTEPMKHESPTDAARPSTASPERSVSRKTYVAPRIERRIPVAANTLQPTSGSETVFPP